MNEENIHDEQALAAQLEQAREKLSGLERQLYAVDCELEGHSLDRQRYQLLHEICGGLEKLGEFDALELFWDGVVSEGRGGGHVQLVRGRVDDFNRRYGEIERSRQAVIAQIRAQQEDTEYLEDDVLEAQREEEDRKLEWNVERDIGELPERRVIMPWTRGAEDEKRLRKSLLVSLLLSLLFGLVFPMIDLPLPDPWKVVDVPDRLTRLINEERQPPPPVTPAEAKPRETKPEPTQEPVVAEHKTPEPQTQPAPKKPAESKGILAFREKFSGLAENESAARLGAQARINRSGETRGGRTQRSMVASQTAGTSGGIDLAALSRDVGGGGSDIESVEITQATSAIGTGLGSERPLSGGPGPSRTDEEIQIVFDRHKAALYRLYNRELRRDPTLKGQMVLRMKIEPDGSVSLCEIQSTDMSAPQLAAQVLERVKNFDFGAKEGVPTVAILYPIDFLPAI